MKGRKSAAARLRNQQAQIVRSVRAHRGEDGDARQGRGHVACLWGAAAAALPCRRRAARGGGAALDGLNLWAARCPVLCRFDKLPRGAQLL